MISLGKDTTNETKAMLTAFTGIQGNSIVSYQIFLDQMNSDISAIDGSLDSDTIMTAATSNAEPEPDDFQFIPCGLWKEGVRRISYTNY